MTRSEYLNWKFLLAIPFLLLGYLFGFVPDQSDFTQLISIFLGFFLIFILAYHFSKSDFEVWFFVSVAFAVRLILVFSIPNLSDDYFRFVWDGSLSLQGINPYSFTPGELFGNDDLIYKFPEYEERFINSLNSTDYYSVYPPVNQAVFSFSAFMGNAVIEPSISWMKIIFLFAEAWAVYFMVRLIRFFKIELRSVLLYTLNPIIILEAFNNLHFEIIMVCFLMVGFWNLVNKKLAGGAIALSLAISTKLIPLIFLPFLIKPLGLKKSLKVFVIIGMAVTLIFTPVFLSGALQNFSSSVDLYFRKFEYNGSVYYLLRWLGYQIKGHNLIHLIGPALGLITLLSIVWLAVREKSGEWLVVIKNCLLALTIFLFLATTVHPWYLTGLVALCVFTNFRYPILWSLLIMFTYINYSYPDFHENLWVVAVEYVLLAVWMLFAQPNVVRKFICEKQFRHKVK